MASIKLNSNRHESKATKIKRKNTLKHEVARGDRTGLKPNSNLKAFGLRMFKAIKANSNILNNADNATVNILCHEYDIYNDCINYLNKNGLTDDKGNKNPYVSILKQATDEIIKLENALNLTPKNRISTDMNKQDTSDPLKRAVEDGDNE